MVWVPNPTMVPASGICVFNKEPVGVQLTVAATPGKKI